MHVSYHWHLHQPIYWPETAPGTNRCQFAKESLDLKLANSGNFYGGSGFKHPRNALVSGDGGEFDSVFDKDDRRAAYQSRGRDAIASMTPYQDAGASVSYSGALMENIGSLGRANAWGYGSGWNSSYATARGWTTRGGYPKADLVGMTYHHAFSPLLPRAVLRKEIQIFKELWWKTWGGNPDKSDHSRGWWPVECAFSRHLIPVLLDEGYQWVIIPNSHLARTCQNYLQVAARGNGGWNIDPPNRADRLGPTVPAGQWYSGSRDGRGGAFPAPFAYQAHKAKWVDPATGTERKITIVPMCDLLSYENGYGPMGTGVIDAEIAPFNDPARPSIVLLAHDGDNAWGGGYSYYLESVPQLASAASGRGYRMTTIAQFLADHPVPDSATVHIEDGAWFNAANDWGHPQFINWLWPPTRAANAPGYQANDPRTWYDLETPGWTEDWRNWAVLMAGANWCETAEQITVARGGSVQAWKIQEPSQTNGTNNNPNAAEQAWHYYLGGLDSGFMYYGTSLDDEVKQTLASNKAIGFAESAIGGDLALDATPPTVFKPQRFPWNPGGKGWGPLTGYRPVGMDGAAPYSSDFHIWTLVHDVSGTASVTLKVRVDADGLNPVADNSNEIFAGGNWLTYPMNPRAVPTGNVTGNPNIAFFLTPTAIATHYWAKVTGFRNVLLDYYVEAVDSRGNIARSDIQHVYVEDDGTTTTPPDPPLPPAGLRATAVSSSRIDLAWDASAGATSYVVRRGGASVGSSATTSFSDTGLTSATAYTYEVIARNSGGDSAPSSPASATTLAPALDFAMDGVPDSAGYKLIQPGMNLYAAIRGTKLYVATWTPAGGVNDHFILVTDTLLPGATSPAPWGKAGLTALPAGKPFLAAESTNNFIGWSNAPAGSPAARGATGGLVMEGTLDLAAVFGAVPPTLYFATAAYGTADGAAVAALAPGGAGPNIPPAGFHAIPSASIRDRAANGTFDVCDSARRFYVTLNSTITGEVALAWPSVPGWRYRVQATASFDAPWQDLAPAQTAPSGADVLTFTETPLAAPRFYRIVATTP